jgi:hypothetical protein
MSVRSQQGHYFASGSEPSTVGVFAYYGIAKINSDLGASVQIVGSTNFDGGVDGAAFYDDGGDNNAYNANFLAGSANNVSALASRPTVGSWFKWYLDSDGTTQRVGWKHIGGSWVSNTVGALTAGQTTTLNAQSLGSNSNPANMDCACWRAADGPLTQTQYDDDLRLDTSTLADIFDFLLTSTASTPEQSGSGATLTSQGGSLSNGDAYTFEGPAGGATVAVIMANRREQGMS